ncbi:MAG: protein kinase [Deltaproteobacteria bacterium]|nr:protein kinase [Deltaproteobacteria bacterium]
MTDGPPAIGVGAVLHEQYELRTVLGEGANGVVYEAWDRALARRVAVKVRRAGCERSVHDEARALAAIHHPSVVAVLGIGSAGGHDFMVTELVPGLTWGHRLAVTRAATGQPPPPEESVDIAMHVADALASIHRVGLVHGDVKPSNIVVADGRIVLTDFGLARPALLDTGEGEAAFGGTPTYAAPELFEGKVLPTFGHSVDVYALGVTLFEVLVGQPPYASTDPTELAHLHLHAPVPRVVDFVSVPRRLSALVASMMHKDPSERTESMEVVLFQLKLVRRELDGDTLRPLEILIVDDDPDIARLLAFYVREELPDARIEVVHDGFEAMDVVRRRHPHLILLDLNLPRVSGFEVYAYLRGAGLLRQSSVITVSAAAKRDDEELLLELGVGACIQKDAMLRSNVRARVKSLAFKHGFDSTAPLAFTP